MVIGIPNVGSLGLWTVNLDGTGLQRIHAGPASAPSVNFGRSLPQLAITRVGNSVTISWPNSALGFLLEAAQALTQPINFTAVTALPSVIGDRNVITFDATGGTTFFRLRQR